MLSPLLWLLAAASLVILSLTWRAARGRLAMAALIVTATSFLAMTPLFANLLVARLENFGPPPAACSSDPPSVAVVLSGGVDRKPRGLFDLSAIGIASRRRADSAVAWWGSAPGRRLVFAGGRGWPESLPEGDLLANYAKRLGVPADLISVERESADTWENAINVAAMEDVPKRVVLVTSAMHMPRARYSMEQAGFEVCSLGADWNYVPFRAPNHLVPSSGGVVKTERALHEVVGLLYYRLWRGRAPHQ
ncbi:YdcF family protein [uncultured Pseudoxanthomonas sp.]|uniref:YdcF family protein n=1 Tax=uncultured Pseudoxanthomonas sp. TaxID=281701 RepID=UPI00262B72A1|nr:YdcF family protein [uncultured Pseudoxanthomonas sp.]